jgi:hypothetical protein
MIDLPERIFAWNDNGFVGQTGGWSAKPLGPDETEYIRADLHEAEVARLTAERDAAVAASQKLAAENSRLLDAMREAHAAWVSVCNAHDWDPDHLVQFKNARAFLAGGDK